MPNARKFLIVSTIHSVISGDKPALKMEERVIGGKLFDRKPIELAGKQELVEQTRIRSNGRTICLNSTACNCDRVSSSWEDERQLSFRVTVERSGISLERQPHNALSETQQKNLFGQ
jgi:hypothetical protein